MSNQYDLPVYEAPTVVSYSDAEILEELGPASTNNYWCNASNNYCNNF